MSKNLKNRIKNAYENETPDLRDRVISACENETQIPAPSSVRTEVITARKHFALFRRLVAVASCLILFGVGLFVGRFLPDTQPIAKAETCIYLDVNPSLELSLDQNNTVLSCTAANEDAEQILNGMELAGVELKTALNAIVGSMYVKGYLSSENNSILVSVDKNDTDNMNAFLTYITDQVNEVFTDSEMECAIIAQGVKADEELKRRAEENGISVGKMHLLDKMVESMDSLTEEDISQLSDMSIKDLNLLYSEKSDKKEDAELISGTIAGYMEKNDVLNVVLTELERAENEVEEYHIRVLPSKHEKITVVYSVRLKFKNDNTTYEYEVDCQTGEVSVKTSDEQEKDKAENKEERPFEDGSKKDPADSSHEGENRR